MERLNDIKHLALSIVEKYYPNTKCTILTGSQIETGFVTPQSDIDIVLIDKTSCDISSDGIKEKKLKVDSTRVGFLNLTQILIENSYLSSPVVLHMITDGAGLSIKQIAMELSKNLH